MFFDWKTAAKLKQRARKEHVHLPEPEEDFVLGGGGDP
jgi:hypothetical protein